MSEATTELLRRTDGCGELGEGHIGREVVVTGWVHKRRDLGQLIFVEVRDHTGLVQVVFDPSEHPAAHAAAEGVRGEYVIAVEGRVTAREQPNPEHPTGSIELRGARLVVHNRAGHVPFPVDDAATVNEEARLEHRYVDLRRPLLQRRMRLRHAASRAARRVLDEQGFVEVETPMLTRSTPEGARDYLVPSRVSRGSFYALPQSPQLFKQLLMVAGFDRYYQFARCFRDEDLRADRQPEFTQIDIEMSFVTPETIYDVIESMMVELFRCIDVELPRPFRRMAFDEAIARYGTDRPDTRFGIELRDADEAARGGGFRVFDDVLESGGRVRGIAVPGGASASRKDLERWTGWAKASGAGGLVWVKLAADGGVSSSALKVLGESRCRAIAEAAGAGPGDAALFAADRAATVDEVLGTLRVRIAGERGLVPEGRWDLVWIEGFPLAHWDEAEGRWYSYHHPFTAPRWDEVPRLESEAGAVRSQAYDLVLNGTEIGGGSIRIHRRDVQDAVFRVLGIDAAEAEEKFGFLLRALDSGAPPHGGIAMGFDRICAMLAGAESIRDVIAFPKTTSASCLMTRSPAPVDEAQIHELGLSLRPES